MINSFLFFVGIKIIETSYVSNLFSKRISKILEKRTRLKIDFDSLDLGFFPPSTTLNTVVIYGKGQGNLLETEELGIYFSLFDFFRNKVKINKILVKNGKINLPETKEKDESSIKINQNNFIPAINSFYKKYTPEKTFFPLSALELENVKLHISDKELNLKSVKIITEKKSFSLLGEIGLVHIPFKNKVISVDNASFSIDFTEDTIRIEDILLNIGNNYIAYKGKINHRKDENYIKGHFIYRGTIFDVKNLLDIKNKYFENVEGQLNSRLIVSGNLKRPVFKADTNISNFSSPYGNFLDINLKMNFDGNIIAIDKIVIQEKDAKLENLQKINVFNLSLKKVVFNGGRFKIQKFPTEKALYYLKPLRVITGLATGQLDIHKGDDWVDFIFSKNFSIEDFKLLNTHNLSQVILKNENLKIPRGTIRFFHKNKSVNIDIDLNMKKSMVKAEGIIDSKGINLNLASSQFNFEDLGPIVNFKMKGRGKILGSMKGPFRNVNFRFNSKLEGVEVIGYNLGKVDGNIDYSFKKKILKLKGVRGQNGITFFDGDAQFNFNHEKNYRIFLNISRGASEDIHSIYAPLIEKIENYQKYRDQIDFFYKTNFKINGSFVSKKIKINGNVSVKNATLFSEDIQDVELKFLLKDKIISLNNIKIKKNNHTIFGNFAFNAYKHSYNYDFNINNFPLKDFNFYKFLNINYTGMLSGYIRGKTKNKKNLLDINLKVKNGKIGTQDIADSILLVRTKKSHVDFKVNFAENLVNINMLLASNGKVSFNSSVNIEDMAILARLLSEHNVEKEIEGQFLGKINANFYLSNWKKMSLELDVFDFNFREGDFFFKIDKGKKVIRIKNGKIKKWDMRVSGNRNFILSRAQGDLSKDFKIYQEVDSEASFLEYFFDSVRNVDGRLRITHNLSNRAQRFFSEARELGFDLPYFFGSKFKNINYKLNADNQKITLSRFQGIFDEGKINAYGEVILSLPYPKVSMNVNMNDVKLLLLKKTDLIIKSDLTLSGDKIPYNINGSVTIKRGIMSDSLNDLIKKIEQGDPYSKFIPKNEIQKGNYYFHNNLNVNIQDVLEIKNNLVDFKIKGSGTVKGPLYFPLINGTFTAVPKDSKFFFRGNEFSLREGFIRFKDQFKKEVPDLKLIGNVRLGNYDVQLDVNGPIQELAINLSSEPSLSQPDLLSLLTIGITSNVKESLDLKEQRSILTLGLGGLLIDQLKLREGIGSSLDFRVNILPEFSKKERSLLEGRTVEAEDNKSSTINTGTKIEIQKRLSPKTSFTLSSTVGKSIEQKQQIDINYSINKNWSLEGVYEVHTSDDLEEENSTNSIGADIKYRWSF